ncbi:hypothetical protein B0H13DRAFT_1884317 [Mycena leptocephala]|nr:hypothetical protein B0H13DRAFT_1884317 [Mycena leptocephala]
MNLSQRSVWLNVCGLIIDHSTEHRDSLNRHGLILTIAHKLWRASSSRTASLPDQLLFEDSQQDYHILPDISFCRVGRDGLDWRTFKEALHKYDREYESKSVQNPTDSDESFNSSQSGDGDSDEEACLPDRPDSRDYEFPFDSSKRQGHSADLRDSCPPVVYQGHMQCCTADSVAASFEFGIEKRGLTAFHRPDYSSGTMVVKNPAVILPS